MSVDLGMLVLRVLFGAAMAAHGGQKLFGWFGGYGLKATGGFFEQLGFRPGVAFAAAAGLSEFGGGVLLAVGLFTPFGAAAILAAMLVAMATVHLKNGFFAMTNGIELPLLYATVALGFLLGGGGVLSFDALLRLEFLNDPNIVGAIFVLTLIGTGVTLSLRKRVDAHSVAAR